MVSQDLDAMVCWLTAESSLQEGKTYTIQHTSRATRATVRAVDYRLDMNTLHRDEDAARLELNEIGRVRLRTQKPLMFDQYRRNRQTGAFILVDEATNNTVAAGIITGAAQPSTNIAWHSGSVTREQRGSQGATLWFTGLSGSGKSTVAAEVERRLVASGRPAYVLDGDNLRHGLKSDLGFTPEDRRENVRRTAEVAMLLADAGVVALVSLVSPDREDRDAARAGHFDAGLPFLKSSSTPPLTPPDVATRRGCTRAPERERSPTSPAYHHRTRPPCDPICC